MKKIKLAFHFIYVLTIIFVIGISIDITGTLDYMMKIGLFKYFSDLPYMGRNLLLFLSALMIVEFSIQNFKFLKFKS